MQVFAQMLLDHQLSPDSGVSGGPQKIRTRLGMRKTKLLDGGFWSSAVTIVASSILLQGKGKLNVHGRGVGSLQYIPQKYDSD